MSQPRIEIGQESEAVSGQGATYFYRQDTLITGRGKQTKRITLYTFSAGTDDRTPAHDITEAERAGESACVACWLGTRHSEAEHERQLKQAAES